MGRARCACVISSGGTIWTTTGSTGLDSSCHRGGTNRRSRVRLSWRRSDRLHASRAHHAPVVPRVTPGKMKMADGPTILRRNRPGTKAEVINAVIISLRNRHTVGRHLNRQGPPDSGNFLAHPLSFDTSPMKSMNSE